MKLEVITSHQTNYPNPISFKVGDSLKIGIRDSEYKGWIRVTTSSGNEGWTPEEYINLQVNPPLAINNYSATELNTTVGEILELIHILNEWAWVKNSNGDLGWVPYATTKHV